MRTVTAAALLMLLWINAPLWATGADETTGEAAAGRTVELTFTFWGSAFEREAVELMIQSFNDSHPGILMQGRW